MAAVCAGAGKTDCLILDYAGNPHDLYARKWDAEGQSDNVPVQVFCPACGVANTFWGKTTADGTLIEHFGRRCGGSKMTTATANSATSAFALKLPAVCERHRRPPLPGVRHYWLTRTIC